MPVAGTFHSIGVFFLRQFIDRIGYSKDFVIYDEDDKLKLIKQICSEKNIDEKEAPARQILFQISAAKNDGIRPENFE
jgi:DNA helicase-2/ATP-dependent DNA helicase PcrA